MKSKLRDTGNQAKPIRVGHAIGELMWDEGESFRFVPREHGDDRFAEVHAMDSYGGQVMLVVDAGALRTIQKEAGRLADWIEKGDER